MDKYKINIIFNKEKDINDILINVLNREIKKNIQMISKSELTSCTNNSKDGGRSDRK